LRAKLRTRFFRLIFLFFLTCSSLVRLSLSLSLLRQSGKCQDVGLYHSTFVFGASQEYATVSNGVLSTLRIINAARSPCACQYFNLKFGIKVEVETIREFERRLMEYIKDRPREWLKPICFRVSGIQADLGYIGEWERMCNRNRRRLFGSFKYSHVFFLTRCVFISFLRPSDRC
jgi:hypothetical protein